MKLFLLSLSLEGTILKIIELCSNLFVKLQKVKLHLSLYMKNLEKKTIVFDIDETLVLATTNRADLKGFVDETIFIKMTRFGGQAKAFLSFRPYLHEMLDELSKDFELILYTCGTAAYAACFAEAV